MSSTFKHLPKQCASVDVATLSGADAVALLRLVNPSVTAVVALRDTLAARAVEANQHRDSKSSASFVGTETGISEKTARGILARQKALDSLPDVAEKLRAGELPQEKADVITQTASDDSSLARDLLNSADDSTVEEMRLRASNENAKKKDRHKRLRHSQYVSVPQDNDNMVMGTFRMLPEVAATWLPGWRRIERSLRTPWEKAEAFSKLIGGASKVEATPKPAQMRPGPRTNSTPKPEKRADHPQPPKPSYFPTPDNQKRVIAEHQTRRLRRDRTG